MNGSVTILHSGLKFGTVCPGTNTFDVLPVSGCSSNNIKLGPISRTESGDFIEVKYQWIIEQGEGGTLALLLMFTQAVNDTILKFPSNVLVEYLTSPTDVLIQGEQKYLV